MSVKRKSLLLSLMLGFALALPGVAGAQNYPESVKQLVASTKKQVKTIDMQQFKAAFDRRELGLIVDVRNPDEYQEGYVPGAVNVPRGLLEFVIWNEVGYPDKTDMNKQMTLYCKTGGRCALATKALMDLGFTNVTAADMKIEEWKKAGYPLVKPAE
jgi:rhodanese-related sulfurtransferase